MNIFCRINSINCILLKVLFDVVIQLRAYNQLWPLRFCSILHDNHRAICTKVHRSARNRLLNKKKLKQTFLLTFYIVSKIYLLSNLFQPS